MKKLMHFCCLFVCQVALFNFFAPSNGFILAPQNSQIYPPKDYGQLLMLVGQDELVDQPLSDKEIEDLVMKKIVKNIRELDATKNNKQLPQLDQKESVGQDFLIAPNDEDLRDRRQAMGIFNDKYFSFRDKLATEQLKTKLFGQAKVSKSTCLSTLLRAGINSVEELMRAEDFCTLQS